MGEELENNSVDHSLDQVLRLLDHPLNQVLRLLDRLVLKVVQESKKLTVVKVKNK